MKTEGCPHLGLRGDPHTFTAFASTANYCHRVISPTAIDLAHQEGCCLTAEHVQCPVFLAQAVKTLPPEIRGSDWQKQRQRGLGRVVLALVLFVVAVGLFLFAWQNRSQLAALLGPAEAQADEPADTNLTPTRSQAISTSLFVGILPVPSIAPTRTPTATPTATLTRVPSPTPTDTATPTRTTTATLMPTITASATVPVVNTVTALIIVERANIRSGPGPDYGVVGVAALNQQLTITGRTNAGDWWQVCCVEGNQQGWLFGELVTTVGDISTVPAVPAPPLELTQASPAP